MTRLIEYANGLGANKEVTDWISTTLKARSKKHELNEEEAEHIIDYLVSSAAPKRLQKLSYADASRKSAQWSKTQQKKGRHLKEEEDDTETIHDFGDGTRIAKLLSKTAYTREGFLMRHCLGGYNPESTTIYSYRDEKNEPHATFEVSRSGDQIIQIKGKGNGGIHPKYIGPILVFLKSIGLNIRPHDMKNLGYYHVPADAIPLINQFVDKNGKKAPLVALYGENYIVA